MILILSEYEDNMTDKVCNYLNYYNKSYLRLNKQETENILSHILFFDKKIEVKFSINNKQYFIDDFKSIWCRRGRFHFHTYEFNNIYFHTEIGLHFGREKQTLLNYIYEYIADDNKFKVLNNPMLYNVNKLKSLSTAQKHGLKVPPTIITNRKFEVTLFPFKSLITKNIQDNLVAYNNGKIATNTQTMRVSADEIKGSFFYSKFQKEISKKYELRIFYLNGYFYSLAYICNNVSEIDSRNLDEKIRYIPFILPKKLEKKLTVFMKTMKLESGSIDMIVDVNDDFYFLEVNPVGQFDFLNNHGNFQIEKEIAKYLIV